jgi:lipopolysaccharide/colanic/teichoic acid biosynthesis glycosyltransferase
MERAAGFLFLALTAPLTVVSAAAIATLSRRSPLVAHLRIGKNDQPFWMWKLRTMWDKNDAGRRERGWIEYVIADPSGDSKDAADPRVTSRFAAFCRRHSIDELPQLWHVARGEMALVGPRPLTRSELVRHYGAQARELLSVKPGLTGLWQVSGRSHIAFPQRARLDLELVRSLTPSMYFRILLKTFSALVYGKGAW